MRGRKNKAKGVKYMVTEGDLALSGERTMQRTDDISYAGNLYNFVHQCHLWKLNKIKKEEKGVQIRYEFYHPRRDVERRATFSSVWLVGLMSLGFGRDYRP